MGDGVPQGPPQGTPSPVIPLAYGTKVCAQGTLSPVIPHLVYKKSGFIATRKHH